MFIFDMLIDALFKALGYILSGFVFIMFVLTMMTLVVGS